MFASSTPVAGFFLLLLTLSGPAGAMSPEPAQLGRFSAVEGEVQISYAEGDEDRDRASVNHPVVNGARIVAGPSARAEIRIGPNALTLGGQALLDVVSLGEGTLQLRLDEGALILALRDYPRGGQVEVVAPRASVNLRGPGNYRVDAAPGAASSPSYPDTPDGLVQCSVVTGHLDGHIYTAMRAGRFNVPAHIASIRVQDSVYVKFFSQHPPHGYGIYSRSPNRRPPDGQVERPADR